MIACRFALGPLLFWDACDGKTGAWFVAGLVLALGSDVFDGVIARRLNIATPRLREADSWTDGWIGLWIAACVWCAHRDFVVDFAPLLWAWFATDCLALLFDALKFRRFAAYHAYSAKMGGLLLMSALF